MAINKIDSKIRIKRSTIASTIPTMGSSADHTDGTWSSTDIYTGELFYNEIDEKLWIGTGSGIRELNVAPFGATSSSTFILSGASLNIVTPSFGTNTNIHQYSSILGGQNNDMSGSTESKWDSIVGGQNNDIVSASASNKWNSILGGYNNTLTNSAGSSILGGYNSDITSSNYAVSGGRSNKIISSSQSLCIGGRYNTVQTTSTDSIIVGGYTNTITSSIYSSIVGGQNNVINGFDNVHILGSNITATKANATYVEALMNDDNGTVLRKKVIDIGDWNMDTATSKNVAHGLSATEWKTIRTITVLVRRDDDTQMYVLDGVFGTGTSTPEGGVSTISSTNILLERLTTGLFDSTAYDSTSYNRGWVTLEYTPD